MPTPLLVGLFGVAAFLILLCNAPYPNRLWAPAMSLGKGEKPTHLVPSKQAHVWRRRLQEPQCQAGVKVKQLQHLALSHWDHQVVQGAYNEVQQLFKMEVTKGKKENEEIDTIFR